MIVICEGFFRASILSFAEMAFVRFPGTSLARYMSTIGDEGTEFSKRHFKNIVLHNKRHRKRDKKKIFGPFMTSDPEYEDIPIHTYNCRPTGIKQPALYQHIPEMVPELVVPDLTGFKLKPYVTYRAKEIYQEELNSKDLFNAVYGKKILRDYKEGKLDDDGNSAEPNDSERMTSDEAWVKARKTGSDIFLGGAPRTKLWNVRWEYQ